MAIDSFRRASRLAIVVLVLVSLPVGVLEAAGAPRGVARPSTGDVWSPTPAPFASATRSIESTEIAPGETTTVTLEIGVTESVGKISIVEEFTRQWFASVDNVTIEYAGGSGITVLTQPQPDSVSIGIKDVEVGTTITVTYDVTVVDERATYAITGHVEHAREMVAVTGDSEIAVAPGSRADDTPERTPVDDMPAKDAVANLSGPGCNGTFTTSDAPDRTVLAFEFTNQTSDGDAVYIDELHTTIGGIVYLTDGAGTRLGRTNFLPPGEHRNVPVAVDRRLTPGEHTITAAVRRAVAPGTNPGNATRNATITVVGESRADRPDITASAPGRVESTDDFDLTISFSVTGDTGGDGNDSPVAERTAKFVVEFDDDTLSGWNSVTIPPVSIEEGSYREGDNKATIPLSPEEDLDAEPCDLYYLWVVHPESGTAVPTGPVVVVEPPAPETDTTSAQSDGDAGEIDEGGTAVGTPGFGVVMPIPALVLIAIVGRCLSGAR